jgi:hypothetical protein
LWKLTRPDNQHDKLMRDNLLDLQDHHLVRIESVRDDQRQVWVLTGTWPAPGPDAIEHIDHEKRAVAPVLPADRPGGLGAGGVRVCGHHGHEGR